MSDLSSPPPPPELADLDPTGDTVSLGGESLPRPALQRGVCVGRYVLIDCVGEGGMGIVYKAYDPELERAVALKLLHAGSSEESQASVRRERLLREAKALARVSHPNVLAVFDVGTFEGDVFLATEFIEGVTLGTWVRDPARTRAEVLRALIAAGEGLAAAHRGGLVHRDFKPSNVIVGQDGRVRVLDFGLARSEHAEPVGPLPPVQRDSSLASDSSKSLRRPAAGNPSSGSVSLAPTPPLKPAAPALSTSTSTSAPGPTRLSDLPTPPDSHSSAPSAGLLDTTITQQGQILGTPRFMAPEQHTGRGADARSDQFAFCVTLYDALYGELPFEGRGEEYTDNVVDGRIRPAPARSDVPRWLRQLLVRGLAREPADRHASMDALLTELRRDPAAARRRWLTVGAALVTAIAIGVGVHRARPAARCEGAEQKLAGVWDDAKKKAMHDAFVATKRADAEDLFVRTSATLDAYAASWVGMHVDACKATHERGEQSEEMLDLRVECLRERREDLRAQVDVLLRADASSVDKSLRAALALPRVDACADSAALRAPIRPPSDGPTRARVDAVRIEIAQAKALQRAGKYAEALSIAERATQEANAIAYTPLEGEASFELGDLQDDTGEYATAEKTLAQSASAALAGRDDAQAARAMTALVAEIGLRQLRFPEAHQWALVAEGQMARVSDPVARGELPRNEARMLQREGKYDQAREAIERCLAIWEPTLGRDSYVVSGAVTDRGNVFYAQAKYDEAVANYRRSLAAGETIFGPNSPVLAANSNNLGEVYIQLGEWELAKAPLERAHTLWENALGPDHPKVALALSNIAAAHAHTGDLVGALAEAERALAIWTKALGSDHPDVALGLHGVAEIERARGNLDRALSLETRALAIRERALGPTHEDVAESLASIGETHLAQGDAKGAVAPLDRALTILESHAGNPAQLGDVRFDLSRATALTDPARSRALAAKAREAYASAQGPRAAQSLRALDAWDRTL